MSRIQNYESVAVSIGLAVLFPPQVCNPCHSLLPRLRWGYSIFSPDRFDYRAELHCNLLLTKYPGILQEDQLCWRILLLISEPHQSLLVHIYKGTGFFLGLVAPERKAAGLQGPKTRPLHASSTALVQCKPKTRAEGQLAWTGLASCYTPPKTGCQSSISNCRSHRFCPKRWTLNCEDMTLNRWKGTCSLCAFSFRLSTFHLCMKLPHARCISFDLLTKMKYFVGIPGSCEVCFTSINAVLNI